MGREHIFRKTMKKRPDGEKCIQESLDGEFDVYMFGLGGAEKRKC